MSLLKDILHYLNLGGDFIMNEEAFREDISAKINQLISLIENQNNLLGYLISEKEQDTKERMWLLSNLGFQSKDIAKILQTSPNTVNVRLSEKRKELKSQ